MPTEAEVIANKAVEEDCRYTQGRACLQEGKLEDAVDLFSSLLQSCVEEHGEMTLPCAKAYFEYGNALLSLEEENSAAGVLGKTADGEQHNTAEEPVDDEEEEGGEQEKQAEGEGEEASPDEEEPEGDLQIAWEVLDVARKILEAQPDNDKNILLSEVFVRLGDLKQMNEDIAGSLDEYKAALKIREQACEPFDRAVSSIHYTLGTTHLYNSKEKSTTNPVEELEKAIHHYQRSKETLGLWLNAKGSQADTEKVDEVRELVDVLTETLTSLDEELKEAKVGTSASQVPASTTTIGFGSSSSSSSAAPPAAASSCTETKRPAQDVNTMQVKKRKT